MGRMLTAVAGETGQPLRALLDEPLWTLLYTFRHLEERDARRALNDRLTRVDQAILNGHGFAGGSALSDELQKAHAEIAAFERGPVDEEAAVDALRARGLALAERVEAGRVLSPEALVS